MATDTAIAKPKARGVAPRTIFTGHDNLKVLRGMNSDSVDLIYLDPPFNSNRNYAAPVGSAAAGAAFKDTWTLSDLDLAEVGLLAETEPKLADFIRAAGQVHGGSMMSYLTMMATRLLEMRRVLKPEGSIYLHCDDTAGAYLKVLMDSIFGATRYRNEITWVRHTSGGKIIHDKPKQWGRGTDRILFYSGDDAGVAPWRPLDDDEVVKRFPKVDHNGERYTRAHLFNDRSMPARPNQCYEWHGFTNPHPSGWRLTRPRLEAEYNKGNIVINGDRIERRRYYRDYKGHPVGDAWTDISLPGGSSERVGYPTQKPVALLERIITASSKPGDRVLDPFCGCATTCIAAEKLGRDWVGIDISPMAATLVERRLHDQLGLMSTTVIHRDDIPHRTDIGKLPPYRSHKQELYGAQAGDCAGCGTHFEFKNLTVDHIVPKDIGGGDNIENLQLLCGWCNSTKGTGTMAEFKAKLAAR